MIGKGGGSGFISILPPELRTPFRVGGGGGRDANCLIGMEGGKAPDIFKEAFLYFGQRNCFLPVAEE